MPALQILKPIHSRTQKFRDTFFPNSIDMWLNHTSSFHKNHIHHSSVRKSLLSIIKPKKALIFGIHDYKGLKYLTQLRVNNNNLNYYKFNHNFKDTLSPDCSCLDGVEDTAHFLLSCIKFKKQRDILTNSISKLIKVNFDTFTGILELCCVILFHAENLRNFNLNSCAHTFY